MSNSLVITTPVLHNLNRDAQHRNRSLKTEWLDKNVDPDGYHLLEQILLHNEVEWRCRVLIKVRGSMEPEIGWIDVSFDNWNRAVAGDTIIRKAFADAEEKAQ
jgi:hypothetical protein